MDFFLTPPIFQPKTHKQPKNSGQLPDISKILPQKILVGIAQKLTQKIQKVDPPLLGPKGGVFEIRPYLRFLLGMQLNKQKGNKRKAYFGRKKQQFGEFSIKKYSHVNS